MTQIEAIVDKFFASIEQYAHPDQQDEDRKRLIDELTAAQVGEQYVPKDDPRMDTVVGPAQVGESVDTAERYVKASSHFEQIAKTKAATIERCAQVAEKDGWHKAAAAIRKLKDES